MAQTLFGVTTYYRREDDGSLSVKLEGRLEDVPLFDQVAVLREVDLFYKWAPFTSSSLTIAHLDKMDTVGWFVVGLPNFGLMRDACFRAIGCDSISEDGSILLVAQGIADKPKEGAKKKRRKSSKDLSSRDGTGKSEQSWLDETAFNCLSDDSIIAELELPEAPTRMGSGRVTIRTFQAIIHVESPTSASTRIIANIDPNLPLIPQSLLDFLMKKLCGVMLYKLQKAATKISKDPIRNAHAYKMRQEEDFYLGWLMQKFKNVCRVRGWNMPPASAFDLSDQERYLAQAADKKRSKSTSTRTMKLYNSLSEDNLNEFLSDSTRRSETSSFGQSKGPRLRAMHESDSISELSQSSTSTFGSIFRNNPIAMYMRELEMKTQLKKARKVEMARERAANRLKPKALDSESQSRLDELRAARERRTAGDKVNKKEVPSNGATSLKGEKHQLGMITKVFVILILVVTLFCLLYMDSFLEMYTTFEEYSNRKKDSIVIFLILLSGTVHFTLCYVALIFTFSALQLGSIAGREARKFYSQNVHLIVGVSSGSMVFLGIAKASSIVMLRWIVGQFFSKVGWVLHYLYQSTLFSFMGSLFPEVTESSLTSWKDYLGRVFSPLQPILALFDNIILRGAVKVAGSISFSLVSIWSRCIGFVNESIGYYEGRVEVKAWREDAHTTTRVLLAYSAMFLLILLIFFNLAAKQARTASERIDSEDLQSMDGSECSNSVSNRSDLPAVVKMTKLSRSVSSLCETIDEVGEQGKDQASKKKKRLELGFRRRRKEG